MSRSWLALLAAALPALPAAAACPAEGERILFHSCHGPAVAELLLLPEEAPAVTPPPADSLTVTGGYTGTDLRAGGQPNPVGLFVDDGLLVSPNLARMDGILVIDPAGEPRIHHATRVPLRGRADEATVDLTDPDQRLDFAARAAEQGVSVLQSHLLITDGRLDVRQQMDAPRARRRILFSGSDGWGVFQTTGAVTLFDAAYELHRRHAPRMALNLDMGSFDFCLRALDEAAVNCGVLDPRDTAKLSNLLRFRRNPD